MNLFSKFALGAAMVGAATGATLATSAPANAGVSVGIGIGIPGPVVAPAPVYGYPANCWYYNGWAPGCNYPVYNGGVWIGGRWYYGPHYYRWFGGRPYVWNRGGWVGYRGGWSGWRGYSAYRWDADRRAWRR